MTDEPEGDVASFEDFVAARSVALQRFAYLVIGNAEDARDAVQDALLGLLPRWERVTAGGDPEPYVRRSITNAWVSRWRTTGREHAWDPAWIDAPGTDPTASLADAATAVQWCSGLPAKQRAAVVMRFYEDCSYAQIAAVCDTTPGAARVLVHRALASLRAQLEEDSHA